MDRNLSTTTSSRAQQLRRMALFLSECILDVYDYLYYEMTGQVELEIVFLYVSERYTQVFG